MKVKAFQIIGVNQDQLYEHGIGADGAPLPPYSKAYAKRKPARGSIVDIYRSGELYKQMTLTVEGGRYRIGSTTPYTPYVLGRRPTVFGLTDEGKSKAWVIIRPLFVENFKQHLR